MKFFIFALLAFNLSCKSSLRSRLSCQEVAKNHEKFDSLDRCIVLESLEDLNRERLKRQQKPLACDYKKINELEIKFYPVAEVIDIKDLQAIEPYQLVTLNKDGKKYTVGKGYCSKVYLVNKKGENILKVLKYQINKCSPYERDVRFLELMCAITNNPMKGEVLSQNLMVASYIQGNTLAKYIANGSFFSNKDQMKDKMRQLFQEMLKASVLYRDIHPYNIVFDENKKVWAFVDTHYPFLFETPAVALKHLKRTNPWVQYYSANIRKQIKSFFDSIILE